MKLIVIMAAAASLGAGSAGESDHDTRETGTRVAASVSMSENDDATVYTTFYPTAYFAERIAAGVAGVRAVCPLPEGEDPIFWKPSREILAAYQSAGLIVINGAELEKWVLRASLPGGRIVDTTKELHDELITFEATTHSHGGAGEHTHEGIDGHTWLDPVIAQAQAAAIAGAMAERWPEHAAAFEKNFTGLKADLEKLDAKCKAISGDVKRAMVGASHPAYNYLARRYNWDIANFDFDPSAEITDEQLAALKKHFSEGVQAIAGAKKVLLWESTPTAETARKIKEATDAESVVFSPAENVSAEERAAGADYLKVMHANLERLAAVVGKKQAD